MRQFRTASPRNDCNENVEIEGGNIKDIEYEMNTSVKSWRQLPLRIMKRLN